MHLFVHALGASAGGGLTYLRNVIPHLLQREQTVSLLAARQVISKMPGGGGLNIVSAPAETSGLSRFLWEQREIPLLVRKQQAEILLSAGNFAVWKSPVPQILLSRNSLYTSVDFRRDLRHRREFGLLADNAVKAYLARKSIERASITVAPSEAFALELRRWSGKRVVALHHGFDSEQFFLDGSALPEEIGAKIKGTRGAVRLLFVSHYNYYRNFETLFRAIAMVKQRHPGKSVRLFLTCELAPGKNPGNYETKAAALLVKELGLEKDIVQLGTVPYSLLHHVYAACDAYVSPAYTETFAHPLVEAMASGLPILASELPVHREITNGAALFFQRFSAEELAEKIWLLMSSDDLRSKLRCEGRKRAEDFSWSAHVDHLLTIARSLLSKDGETARRLA